MLFLSFSILFCIFPMYTKYYLYFPYHCKIVHLNLIFKLSEVTVETLTSEGFRTMYLFKLNASAYEVLVVQADGLLYLIFLKKFIYKED